MSDIQSLAETGAKSVRRTGQTPTIVARRIIRQRDLDPSALRELAERGLAEFIGEAVKRRAHEEWLDSPEGRAQRDDDLAYKRERRAYHRERDREFAATGLPESERTSWIWRQATEQVQGIMDRYAVERLMQIVGNVTLQGADGMMRSVADFGAEDAAVWAMRSRGQVEGWERRVRFFEQAEQRLDSEGINRIRDLSPEGAAAILQLAAAIWASEDPLDAIAVEMTKEAA